ncbi:MAG: carbon starvation CstA family protein [Pseudomonadota bacterium]|nr:carbon starvation CstA family protein [Pseudomonadota bacterium]
MGGSGPIFAGPVFPVVFITIACGAISGFHAMVASGTTPELLDSDALVSRVGYGSVIMASVVALMAGSMLDPGTLLRYQQPGRPDRHRSGQADATIGGSGYPVSAARWRN